MRLSVAVYRQRSNPEIVQLSNTTTKLEGKMSQAVAGETAFLTIPGEGICKFIMDSPLKQLAIEFVSLQLKLREQEREVAETRQAVEEKFQELKAAVVSSKVVSSVPEEPYCHVRLRNEARD
jgi:hypothetical protein